MLSSMLGQALAMSVNPAWIGHELAHETASFDTNADIAAQAELLDIAEHDQQHDHEGKFGDVAHELLHAAHHIHLFGAPELPLLQTPQGKTPPYAAAFPLFLEVAPDSLFRPPRHTFAS